MGLDDIMLAEHGEITLAAWYHSFIILNYTNISYGLAFEDTDFNMVGSSCT